MRGQRPSYRGWIGLIRKGSGRVSGVARLVDVGDALSPDEMVATFDKHRIPESVIHSGAVAKWTTPWKLADVCVLRESVPYSHPNGAITLFSLDPQVSSAIVAQLCELPPATTYIPETLGNSTPKPAPDRPGPSKTQPTLVASPQPHVSGSLLGETVLTEGNIKNSHFYLTPFLGRFPASMFGGTNDGALAPQQALIDWGGVLPVETGILSMAAQKTGHVAAQKSTTSGCLERGTLCSVLDQSILRRKPSGEDEQAMLTGINRSQFGQVPHAFGSAVMLNPLSAVERNVTCSSSSSRTTRLPSREARPRCWAVLWSGAPSLKAPTGKAVPVAIPGGPASRFPIPAI